MAEGKAQYSDEEAVKKALEKLFSTKSTPRNRGFGLDTLKSIVHSCNGHLKIVTNKACLQIQNKSLTTFPLKKEFVGTHYEIVLDLEYFPENDNNTFDFDV